MRSGCAQLVINELMDFLVFLWVCMCWLECILTFLIWEELLIFRLVYELET